MFRDYTGYVREGFTYATYFFRSRRKPQIKFLIFTVGRTGSSLLVNLLDSHPGIYCRDEMLGKKILLPKQYLMCNENLSKQDVYGFKLNTFHFRIQKIHNPVEFVIDLHQEGYKIIHLKRRNIVRQAISHLYAKHREKFHHKENQGEQIHQIIKLDIEELKDELQLLEGYLFVENQIIESVKYLRIYYEDDLLDKNNHQETVDRIYEYLGIKSVCVRTDYVKTTPEDLSRFIVNFDEVMEYLAGTRYAKYIEG